MFFTESNDALNNIILLYDTIWSIVVGLSNLRTDYYAQIRHTPNMPNKDLNFMLCAGANVRNLNHKGVFLNTGREEQLDETGTVCMINAIAIQKEIFHSV